MTDVPVVPGGGVGVSEAPAPTDPPGLLAELRELLEAERQAALRADVDGLLALQESKRVALAALDTRSLPAEELDPLSRRARSNVALMRHLVDCLRGLASTQTNGTYAPDGGLAPRPGRSRGAL